MEKRQTTVADPGGGLPLSPRFLQNHAVFRQFLRKIPILSKFWAQGPPLGSKLRWAPLTKILDLRLGKHTLKPNTQVRKGTQRITESGMGRKRGRHVKGR